MNIRKICKKIFSVFLAILIIGSFMPLWGISLPDLLVRATAADIVDLLVFEYNDYDTTATITGCDDSISGDVVIPSEVNGYNITEIGYEAFSFCRNITSVTIPESVIYIQADAFEYCSNLNVINLPDTDIQIARNAFAATGYVSTLDNWENGVLYIDKHLIRALGYDEFIDSAINTMDYFESDYEIREGTITVSEQAFEDCIKLESLRIPASIKKLGNNAFDGCSNLAKFEVDENNAIYSSDTNGVLFSKDRSVLEIYPVGLQLKEYTVPNTVLEINCFSKNTFIEKVSIPDTVESIFSFSGCSNLKTVNLPSSLSHMHDEVFYGCTLLDNITIPANVHSISANAFSECSSLKNISVDLDNEYYMIHDGVLFNKDMSELVLYPAGKEDKTYSVPESVNSVNSFSSNDNLVEVILPSEFTTISSSMFQGCSSLKNVNIPNGVTKINSFAFADCTSLEEIVIPDSVIDLCYTPEYILTLGAFVVSGVFSGCINLKSVTLPKECTEIGGDMFKDCSSLKNIELPVKLKRIGCSAFMNCTSLETIEIPDSVTVIESLAFQNCDSLTSVYIPDNVTEFGVDEKSWFGSDETERPYPAIFQECDNLKDVRLPSGLEEIGNGMFAYCKNLTTIENISSVKKIGFDSFRNCESLTEITIPKEVVTIDDGAFCGCINLEKVIFEDGSKLESIGKYTFQSTKIRNIIIPESVTSIGTFAFLTSLIETFNVPENVSYIGNAAFANEKLKFIEVNVNNKYYSNDEHGVLFNKNKTILIEAPTVKESTDTYIIPKTVTGIHDLAFARCTWLKKLHVPYSVKSVIVYENSPRPSYVGDIYYEGTIDEFELIENYDMIAFNARIHPNSYGIINDAPDTPEEPKELESIDGNESLIKIYPENGAYDGEVFVDYKEIDLNKNEVDELEAEYARLSANTGAKAVITYDIKVVRKDDNGDFVYADINEGKTVKVKIPVPDDYDSSKNYVILHKLSSVQNENNKLVNYIGKTAIETISGKTYFVIDVEHFSNFTIMEVEKKPILSISIASLPAKTSYIYRMDNLDLSGLALTVTYSDGTTEIVTDTSKMKVTGFDNSKTGEQTVAVEYEGLTAEFSVNVKYAWWQWIIRILLLGFLWY